MFPRIFVYIALIAASFFCLEAASARENQGAAELQSKIGIQSSDLAFSIDYKISSALKIKSVALDLCQDGDCINRVPAETGAVACACQESCLATLKQSAPFYRLTIVFLDRQRVSNVFGGDGKAKFRVLVNSNNLEVNQVGATNDGNFNCAPTAIFAANFAKYFLIVLLIELLVALVYVLWGRPGWNFLWGVLAANIISFPLGWWLLDEMRYSSGLATIGTMTLGLALIQAAMIIFEGLIIYAVLKLISRHHASIRLSLLLSLIVNVVSLLAAEIIGKLF